MPCLLPLRLLQLFRFLIPSLRRSLPQARFLVLDEADKLFELGFMEQVDGIIAACSHKEVVRALFSATLPEKVEELARCVVRGICTGQMPCWVLINGM